MSAALAIPASDRIVTAGDNHPPAEPTAFEIASNSVESVYGEAKHWLDGKKVESQAEASAIGQLLELARRTEDVALEAKGKEKRPHLDANIEIEARFKPLTTRLALIKKTCADALLPWEAAQEAARRAIAEAARREAEEKAAAAQEALRASQQAGLEAREKAEALVREAKVSAAVATKAENAKSNTKVGSRAVSMRTSYRAEITDRTEFARLVWAEHADEMSGFLAVVAQRLVDSGRHQLPGVTVHTERSAV